MKSYQLFCEELKSLKRFQRSQIPSILQIVCNKLNKDLSSSIIESFQTAVEDTFWKGIEPEWKTYEESKWWNNMDLSYFKQGKKNNKIYINFVGNVLTK